MATSYWLFVISSLLVLAAADVNHLDAGQDPVLRRLAIPAQAANANDGGGDGDSLSELDLISLGELKGEEEEQQEQEEQQEAQEAEEEETLPSVKRLWGVPDATAEAGRPFDLTLPSDAFEGHVSRYEISGRDGEPLPAWLVFDPSTTTIRGNPSAGDIGRWTIQVEAFGVGTSKRDVARDVFTIKVVDADADSYSTDCKHLMLYLTLDPIDSRASLSATKRQLTLKRILSRILRTSPDAIEIGAAADVDADAAGDSSDDWIRAGVGVASVKSVESKSRKHINNNNEKEALLRMAAKMSCRLKDDDQFWNKWQVMNANGHLAKKLHARNIVDWHLTLRPSAERFNRQAASAAAATAEALVQGSGDDNDDDEYDYDASEDHDEGDDSPTPLLPSLVSPVFDAPPTTVLPPGSARSAIVPTTTTTATMAIKSTRLSVAQPSDVIVEPTPVLIMPPSAVPTPTPTATPSSTAEDDDDDDADDDDDDDAVVEEAGAGVPVATASSPFLPAPPTTSQRLPDVDASENEVEDDYDQVEKAAPQVTRRLPKMTVVAGKAFRFGVPADTFTDEDGSTRSLKLQLVPTDGKRLDEVLWIGFDADKQEIYGLALTDDIGKWNFTLVARNSANLTASEAAEIQVRQHHGERTFHHRFRLQIEPEFSLEEMHFPRAYWMLRIVKGLSSVIGDKSESSIVVRGVQGVLQNGDSFVVSWSNESLSTKLCPEDDIEEIYEKLYVKDRDEVTQALDEDPSIYPQLSVTLVEFDLEGICKPSPQVAVAKADSAVLPVDVEGSPTTTAVSNSPPDVPNPVDHIEAVAGVLFRFQVPDDTFNDLQDGSTRDLQLQLLNMDRTPLDSKFWLQFDAPNQEFYGLPLDEDVGDRELQLRCSDSQALTTYDGLIVEVKARPRDEKPLVEFSLTIDADFELLTTSAHRKARLIDALAQLYGDADARHIVVRSFQSGSTVMTWHNGSLASASLCAEDEITQLRRVLLDDDGQLTQRAVDVLSAADFVPKTASLVPLGVCQAQFTPTHGPIDADGVAIAGAGPAGDDNQLQQPVGDEDAHASWTDDYLLTFIVPGIIITVMLLLAAVIACVLYRRRRTGKLGLEERRGFASKGIPIIFAEELEERPSGRHPAKAPVILKDEKLSAQTSDYHKPASPSEQRDLLRSPSDGADDDATAGLYQPPPPVSTSSFGRNSRPKATPAYRKPPPYVPP